MTPEQRLRAGRAVAARIRETHTTMTRIAEMAGVDRATVSALIHGRRWPHPQTRASICTALGWPTDELTRRAFSPDSLAAYSLHELCAEISRRVDKLSTEGVC